MIDHAAARRVARDLPRLRPRHRRDGRAGAHSRLPGVPAVRGRPPVRRGRAAPPRLRGGAGRGPRRRRDRRRRHGRGGTGRWAAMAVVGAILVVALGAGVFGAGGSTPPPPAGDGNRSTGSPKSSTSTPPTCGSRRTASASGLGDARRRQSDPGDATYRTLEVTGKEHGVEIASTCPSAAMAVGLDRRGPDLGRQPQGKWLTVEGRFATLPLRTFWSGDLDIDFPVPDRHGARTPAPGWRRAALDRVRGGDRAARVARP